MSRSFSQHASTFRSLSSALLHKPPAVLKIADSGRLSCYYAPFDYINTYARIVICGITLSFQQARISLEIAAEKLKSGSSELEAFQAAKATASFAGSKRNNLIRMLDYCGVNKQLEISSCSELYDARRELPCFKIGIY